MILLGPPLELNRVSVNGIGDLPRPRNISLEVGRIPSSLSLLHRADWATRCPEIERCPDAPGLE